MRNFVFFLVFLLYLCSASQTFSQINISPNGHIAMGDTTSVGSDAQVLIYTNGNEEFGLKSDIRSEHDWGFAVNARAYYCHDRQSALRAMAINQNPLSSGRAYGVYGIAGNCTSGYNYGVLGQLFGSNNGAAVFGSLSDVHPKITGRYAGYFDGNVYVSNTLTAQSITTLSDARYKKDIQGIEETLSDGILSLKPVQYRWNNDEINYSKYNDQMDTLSISLPNNLTDKSDDVHYGLLAQEVQLLFPELVNKDDQGNLSINYIELIPLLLFEIQKINTAVKDLNLQMIDKDKTNSSLVESIEQGLLSQDNYRSTDKATKIDYLLPSELQNAYIRLYDINGNTLRSVYLDLDKKEGSIELDTTSLAPGLYFYSLAIDGKNIDSKRLVVAK